MKVKLTLQTAEGLRDVLMDVESRALVSEVVDVVASHLQVPAVGDTTLVVHRSGNPVVMKRDLPLAEAGILSGDIVSLGSGAPTSLATSAVTVRVVGGPDLGQSFRLSDGQVDIGRDTTCAIRLNDPKASKRHARLVVSDRVEIIDTASSNGVLVDGDYISRAVIPSGTEVTIGSSTLLVHYEGSGWDARHGGVEPFNRSPWLDPIYEGKELVVPQPPQKPQKQHFPVTMLIAPIVMAAALFAITSNAASLLFILLTPLMAVGSHFDSKRQVKRQWEESVEEFHDSMSDLVLNMQRAAEEERGSRRRETPALAEAVHAAHHREPMLWCRRPDQPGFLTVRLGLGTQRSRNQLRSPGERNTTPELWAEITGVAERFEYIDHVPVVGSLLAAGALGVGGNGPTTLDAARGLVAQLAALHSPAELTIAGVVSAVSGPDWNWLKWLPHVGSAFSPLSGGHLASNPTAASALVGRLEQLVEDRATAENDQVPLPIVVVVIDEQAPVDRKRTVSLAERGPAVGVFTLWTGRSRSRLPAVCRQFLDVDPSTHQLGAGSVLDGSHVTPVEVGLLSAQDAMSFARSIAGLDDAGAQAEGLVDLPKQVSFLEEQGMEIADDPLAVIDRWRQSGSISAEPQPGRRGERSLRGYVGSTTEGPLMLDLRTHGPHALVGGTTGAGKSEFLQTWLLSMATIHSPERVNFLLVDYKGGSAFGEVAKLPHSIGMVTDLNQRLVRRALTSLKSELKRRERILEEWSAKDLLDLESKERKGAPVVPSLLIVVDEFAALVNEIPEFVDGMIDVAQRGRSLGLHLILATQRPAGVISGNLRANTNLRVALRMSDSDDSTDVIGTPLAATFDTATPGRAAAKLGARQLVHFQAAYVGGWSTGEPPPPRIDVYDMALGVGTKWELDDAEDVIARDLGATDIERVCSSIRGAFEHVGMSAPHQPLLPVLPASCALGTLMAGASDSALPYGLGDDPEAQRQYPVHFSPDVDGNLIALGRSGSGKSTFLRTLVAAAVAAPEGGPTLVYALDFGGRGLAMIDAVPQVGAVVEGDDDERVRRVIRQLRETIALRAKRYSAVDAGTLDEYRRISGETNEPRILLLIDGLEAFDRDYGDGWAGETLLGVLLEGRAVGVHVVATCDRPQSVPSTLLAGFATRLQLLPTPGSEGFLDHLPLDAFDDEAPAGRCYRGRSEIQIAVVNASDVSMAGQSLAFQHLADQLAARGVPAAPPIRHLPTLISLSTLWGDRVVDPSGVVFGLGDSDLAPVALEPKGLTLVTGPPGSGRTTAMRTIVRSLARCGLLADAVLLAPSRSALTSDVSWAASAIGEEPVRRFIESVADSHGSTLQGVGFVVVEDLTLLIDEGLNYLAEKLISACRSAGVPLLLEHTFSGSSFYGDLGMELRTAKQVLALGIGSHDLDVVGGASSVRVDAESMPAGRAFFVAHGVSELVQVAVPN